jgi:hypothetical protein
MKRTIILAVAIWLCAATFAFAVPRFTFGRTVSYNPSFGQQVKVLAQWVVGGPTPIVTYSRNAAGCLVVTVITLTGTTVTEIPCR